MAIPSSRGSSAKRRNTRRRRSSLLVVALLGAALFLGPDRVVSLILAVKRVLGPNLDF